MSWDVVRLGYLQGDMEPFKQARIWPYIVKIAIYDHMAIFDAKRGFPEKNVAQQCSVSSQKSEIDFQNCISLVFQKVAERCNFSR